MTFRKTSNLYEKIKKIIRLTPETAKLKKEILLFENSFEEVISIREYTSDGKFVSNEITLNDKELSKLIEIAKEELKISQRENYEHIQEMSSESMEKTLEEAMERFR